MRRWLERSGARGWATRGAVLAGMLAVLILVMPGQAHAWDHWGPGWHPHYWHPWGWRPWGWRPWGWHGGWHGGWGRPFWVPGHWAGPYWIRGHWA